MERTKQCNRCVCSDKNCPAHTGRCKSTDTVRIGFRRLPVCRECLRAALEA